MPDHAKVMITEHSMEAQIGRLRELHQRSMRLFIEKSHLLKTLSIAADQLQDERQHTRGISIGFRLIAIRQRQLATVARLLLPRRD